MTNLRDAIDASALDALYLIMARHELNQYHRRQRGVAYEEHWLASQPRRAIDGIEFAWRGQRYLVRLEHVDD